MKYTEPHTVIVQPLRDGVLWMETRRDRDRIELLGCGNESYDTPDAKEDIRDAERLQLALERIASQISSSWMSTYTCVLMIPNARLTARELQSPSIEDEALDEMVAFEVAETLQIDAGTIAWDRIESSKAQSSEARSVFWIAARSTYVQEILQAWPSTLHKPAVITTDFWGVYESLLHTHNEALSSPALIALRTHDTLTTFVADKQSISLMRTVRLHPAAESPGDERACWVELGRTLSYAQSRSETTIETLILANIETSSPAAEEFKQQSERTIHSLHADSWMKDIQGKSPTDPGDMMALLAFSWCHHHVGLSAPNLLRSKTVSKNWIESISETLQPTRSFLTYASTMLAAIVILTIGGYFWHQQAVSSRIEAGDDLIQVAEYLAKEESGLRELIKTDSNYGDLLVMLSEKLPERVLVQNITINDELEIQFSLTGANNQQVVQFVQELNDSPFFRELVSDRVSAEQRGQVFHLRGELRAGGRARS